MEEIFLNTEDGIKIAVNHIKTGSDSVLIIVHGWFMTKDSRPFLRMAKMFSEKFDVISMDCRGHGKSGGAYTFTVQEEKDLKAVADYAQNIYKNIFLAGFSLGGALVLLHASKNENIKKVISVSPPSCFEKIENRFWHPNAWIPTIQKCELKTWFSVRADLKSLIFDKKPSPISVVDKVKIPVLFIAGENDPTVRPWHTKMLFEKAECKKRFELFKNSIHAEDLFIQASESFVDLCFDWLLQD